MSEHARLTALVRPLRHAGNDYSIYLARCAAEGLEPLSWRGWECCRHPYSEARAVVVWRALFGNYDSEERGLYAGRVDSSSKAWKYDERFNWRAA